MSVEKVRLTFPDCPVAVELVLVEYGWWPHPTITGVWVKEPMNNRTGGTGR